MRWTFPRVSDAQWRRLMGASHARLAAKKGLRDSLARCYDSGFLRPGRNLFRYTQRPDIRLARRRKELAKDSRRAAINRLRAECSFRAGVWRYTSELAKSAGVAYNSSEIPRTKR